MILQAMMLTELFGAAPYRKVIALSWVLALPCCLCRRFNILLFSWCKTHSRNFSVFFFICIILLVLLLVVLVLICKGVRNVCRSIIAHKLHRICLQLAVRRTDRTYLPWAPLQCLGLHIIARFTHWTKYLLRLWIRSSKKYTFVQSSLCLIPRPKDCISHKTAFCLYHV